MRVVGAVDIGGTRTKLGVVADDGQIVSRAVIATSPRGEPEPLLAAIAGALNPMLRDAGAALVPRIGVAVAGFLDRDHARMLGNANLPALCDVPLLSALEQRLSGACLLEVDSNAAVVAEYRYGSGRGSRRLLGLTLGTGVGGGVILDGALLRHTGECAGDLGHVIVAPGGRGCTCGASGCLEAMVCAAAVSERAGGRPVTDVVRDASAGDRAALDALAQTGRWLGLGLASLSALFAPDTIVIGGGLAAAGELLLGPARNSYREHAGDAYRDHVRLAGSGFDGWEGLVGAASLAFEPIQPRADN